MLYRSKTHCFLKKLHPSPRRRSAHDSVFSPFKLSFLREKLVRTRRVQGQQKRCRGRDRFEMRMRLLCSIYVLSYKYVLKLVQTSLQLQAIPFPGNSSVVKVRGGCVVCYSSCSSSRRSPSCSSPQVRCRCRGRHFVVVIRKRDT